MYYPRIDETVTFRRLKNGLPAYVVHKPGYTRKYAMFATRYGGMDLRFQQDGAWQDTPAGIAHYLEHKMFDTADGNAMQEMAKNGAEPNAFTSNAMTAYYFDCTEHFDENLRQLLSFVSVPYFTDESVAKEQGIIAQEIGMIEDDPEWQVYKRMLQALYRESPARIPVAGSVESISHITAETLYRCHKAFYTPANMCLVAVGDLDAEAVFRAAEDILPPESGRISPVTTVAARERPPLSRRPPAGWRYPCRRFWWASNAPLPRRESSGCAGTSWGIWPAISSWGTPVPCSPGCTVRASSTAPSAAPSTCCPERPTPTPAATATIPPP